MSATIDGKISFDCPSCAAHLQVPARLAGVTGPCPKCGATIVAPNQSASAGDASEDGGTTRHAHHEDPGSGRKKGFTSLRRRRTRVEAPRRDLKGITGNVSGKAEEPESDAPVPTPFSSLASEAEANASPLDELVDVPEDTHSTSDPEKGTPAAEAEPPVAEAAPLSETAEDIEDEGEPAPGVESKPSGSFSPMPSFLSGGSAGMAFGGSLGASGTSRSADKTASKTEEADEKSKSSGKRPIDLRRDVPPAIDPEPAAEEAPPSDLPDTEAAPAETIAEPAPGSEAPPSLPDEEPETVSSPEAEEPAPLPESEGLWPWQSTATSAEDLSEEEEEVEPPSLVAEEAEENGPMVEATDAEERAPGDFEWLLSDESRNSDSPGERKSSSSKSGTSPSAPAPMVNLENDLDEVIARREQLEGAPPPAPGPFPKWSSLDSKETVGALIGSWNRGPSEANEDEAPPVPDSAQESSMPSAEEAPPLDDPWSKPITAEESPAETGSSAEEEAEILKDDPWAPPSLDRTEESAAPPAPPLEEVTSETPPAPVPDNEESIPVRLRSSRLREGESARPIEGGAATAGGEGLSLRIPAMEQGDRAEPATEQDFPSSVVSSPWKSQLAGKADEGGATADAAATLSAPWLSPQAIAKTRETTPVPETSPPPPLDETEVAHTDTEEQATAPALNPALETREESPETEAPESFLPPPLARLPRFLGGTPEKAEEAEAATPSLSVVSEAPPLPSREEEIPALPTAGQFHAPPSMDLQAFGDGEPPRPGERAAAPGQQIRLPQIAGSSEGESEAKAIVSPISGNTPPSFSPLDGAEADAESSEREPVGELESPKAETEAEQPPRLEEEPTESAPKRETEENQDESRAEEIPASDPSPSLEDSGSEPEEGATGNAMPGDPGDFISARAKAVASSFSLREQSGEDSPQEKSELPAENAGSETPPPVEPEVVSVPSSGTQAAPAGSEPPLDVETEDQEEGGPEDEGLAKVLGLLPQGRGALGRRGGGPEPSTISAAPAEARKPAKERDSTEGPALPSIDDVLEGRGRSENGNEDQSGWREAIVEGLKSLDSRQKAVVFGGGAALLLGGLGIVGLAAGWFSGDDPAGPVPDSGNPTTQASGTGNDSSTTPGKPPEQTTGASGETPASSAGTPSPSPAAANGGASRLVIKDSGNPGTGAPDASGRPGVSPTVAEGTRESGNPAMSSLIPGEGNGDLDRPADIASTVAWAGGEETGGTSVAVPQTGSVGNGAEPETPGAGSDSPNPDTLVLPTVGPVGNDVDPLVSEGAGAAASAVGSVSPQDGQGPEMPGGFEEIGGIGSDGESPTGAPVASTTGSDPEKAMDRQEERVQSIAPIENADEGGAAAAAEPKLNLDDPLVASKHALQQFLVQPTWEKRLAYIYDAERLKPRIEAYYQSAEDGPITESVSKFFDMDEKPADGGDPFYAFYLFLEGIDTEFPVVVRKTDKGYLVDWELFVECKDRLFAEFKNSQQTGPATFRFVMQRHSYWGPDRESFTDSNDYLCYKVEPPYPDAEAFVFVPKDSPVAAQTEKIATWGLPPVDVVLTLERKDFAHGAKHFVIKSLDKESWVAP